MNEEAIAMNDMKRSAKLYRKEPGPDGKNTSLEECFRGQVGLITEEGTERFETAEEILANWLFESRTIEVLTDAGLFSIDDIERHYSGSDPLWCVDIYEGSGSEPVDSASIPESAFLKEMLMLLQQNED